MVAPYRPSTSFFQTLRRLADRVTVLEVGTEAFLAAHDRIWLPRCTHLCLFRIDGASTERTTQVPFVASRLTWQQLQLKADAMESPTTSND